MRLLTDHAPLRVPNAYAEQHPEAKRVHFVLSADLLHVQCSACTGKSYPYVEMDRHALTTHGTRAAVLLVPADQVGNLVGLVELYRRRGKRSA